MTHTLSPFTATEINLPPPLAGLSASCCLRETANGVRTLCITPVRNEHRLGDPLPADRQLDASVEPLAARFAALIFNEHQAKVEPLVQPMRWLAYENGIDHIALPLWPETRLAQALAAVAIDLGLPANFILTQDESGWPCHTIHRDIESMAIGYA